MRNLLQVNGKAIIVVNFMLFGAVPGLHPGPRRDPAVEEGQPSEALSSHFK